MCRSNTFGPKTCAVGLVFFWGGEGVGVVPKFWCGFRFHCQSWLQPLLILKDDVLRQLGRSVIITQLNYLSESQAKEGIFEWNVIEFAKLEMY